MKGNFQLFKMEGNILFPKFYTEDFKFSFEIRTLDQILLTDKRNLYKTAIRRDIEMSFFYWRPTFEHLSEICTLGAVNLMQSFLAQLQHHRPKANTIGR